VISESEPVFFPVLSQADGRSNPKELDLFLHFHSVDVKKRDVRDVRMQSALGLHVEAAGVGVGKLVEACNGWHCSG
jgi:hypothetical protein